MKNSQFRKKRNTNGSAEITSGLIKIHFCRWSNFAILFTPFLNEIYAYIVVNYSYYYCYFYNVCLCEQDSDAEKDYEKMKKMIYRLSKDEQNKTWSLFWVHCPKA